MIVDIVYSIDIKIKKLFDMVYNSQVVVLSIFVLLTINSLYTLHMTWEYDMIMMDESYVKRYFNSLKYDFDDSNYHKFITDAYIAKCQIICKHNNNNGYYNGHHGTLDICKLKSDEKLNFDGYHFAVYTTSNLDMGV